MPSTVQILFHVVRRHSQPSRAVGVVSCNNIGTIKATCGVSGPVTAQTFLPTKPNLPLYLAGDGNAGTIYCFPLLPPPSEFPPITYIYAMLDHDLSRLKQGWT
jgi:hypothetical protein